VSSLMYMELYALTVIRKVHHSDKRLAAFISAHCVREQRLLARLQLDTPRGRVQRRKECVFSQDGFCVGHLVQQRRLPVGVRIASFMPSHALAIKSQLVTTVV
jgi:hypothetical protein